MIKLAVVIPTYNEKDTLPSLIEELVNEIKKIILLYSNNCIRLKSKIYFNSVTKGVSCALYFTFKKTSSIA